MKKIISLLLALSITLAFAGIQYFSVFAADMIGADFYGTDAMQSVYYTQKYFS